MIMNQEYQATTGYGEQSIGVGEWLVTMILLNIPILGLILALIWGFSSNVNKSKQNFAKAYLILLIIGLILGAIFSSVIFGMLAAALGGSMSY
ncbi:MAG: hypothetical protein GX198_02150 [Epulopiscium sp.]|nr:hypothetical protein [Candidatus Epulonipiscium sp.]